ncbi:MAG: alkaline phosphatase family protein [Polyangiaceae bacterium]|nr:alkaline phosphatase family protein [Polyangiaceae bacterium]
MNHPLPICGSYYTDFGILHLSLVGDSVEGTYTHHDGHVKGTLRDGSISGTWVQRGNAVEGTFQFDFDHGANHFQGQWTATDGRSGTWNGVRLRLPQENEGGFPGGWGSHSAGPLLAGPMIGEVGERDARIWVQARGTSPLTLVVESADGQTRRIVRSPEWGDWSCIVFHVDDLRPDATHSYWLENEHGQTPVYPLPLAPSASARAVRIAIGSCFKWYWRQDLPIFDSIANERPECFVMLGDNTYYGAPDWQTEHTMMLAQLRARNNPSLARIIAQFPTLGVWDDHDFGPNDADSRFPGKDMSMRAFRRSWANARWGTSGIAGLFSSVRVGPAELFLLDSRWYRNASAKTLLGKEQLEWLIDALTQSDAAMKIVASPTQVLAEAAVRKQWECFRLNAPGELDFLLREIENRNIRGVVFVSGDLHMANLFHCEGRRLPGGFGPDFWELTASPLANEPWMESIDDEDPGLVSECIDSCNYGIVDIDLDRVGAEVRLICKNERGEVLFEQPVALDTLGIR